MNDTVTFVEKHGTQSVVEQEDVGKLLLLHGGLRSVRSEVGRRGESHADVG